MASPPADLRKIGAEGFALIDKFCGPHRRSSTAGDHHHAFPASGRRDRSWVVHQQPHDEIMEDPAALNSSEAAVHFGGIAVVNFPKGKPLNRWGRSTH